MKRPAYIIGARLCAIMLAGWLGLDVATAQSRVQVRQYVEQMARETPGTVVQQRLARYNALIQYMTSLSFTRPGVTVNPSFVRALISAESAAVPTAVSSKGAIGLMQIMPATGRPAAKALYASGYDFRFVDERRLENLTAEDLKIPAINVLIGCYLLDRYNQRFGNDLAHTVSAWNAGPQAVARYQGAPPYRETLELIGRVNAYYVYFNRRQQDR
jgi:hypothetical protein